MVEVLFFPSSVPFRIHSNPGIPAFSAAFEDVPLDYSEKNLVASLRGIEGVQLLLKSRFLQQLRSSIFAKFHTWFHSSKGIQLKLECLSYALPILICLFLSLLGFPIIAFAAGEEENENREVQPYAEESVSSSPSLPAPSPFRAWGWASDLMAAAPAEVPQADLEPYPSEARSSKRKKEETKSFTSYL